MVKLIAKTHKISRYSLRFEANHAKAYIRSQINKKKFMVTADIGWSLVTLTH